MLGYGRKHRLLVVVREENLKRMSGEKHQIELTAEPHAPRVRLDPIDPFASRPTPSDVEHGGRRIDAGDVSTIGQLCRQLAGAATKIENGPGALRELQAIVEIGAPPVGQIVELRQIRILVQIVRRRFVMGHGVNCWFPAAVRVV